MDVPMMVDVGVDASWEGSTATPGSSRSPRTSTRLQGRAVDVPKRRGGSTRTSTRRTRSGPAPPGRGGRRHHPPTPTATLLKLCPNRKGNGSGAPTSTSAGRTVPLEGASHQGCRVHASIFSMAEFAMGRRTRSSWSPRESTVERKKPGA